MIYWVDIGERRWYWGWRDHREIAGGGWSLDGGVHFANLFRYHVGEVKTLFAVSKAYDRIRYRDRENLRDPIEATVEDTMLATLDFENGVTGQWASTNAAPGHKAGVRALYGSEGAIVWGEGLVLRDGKISMEDLIKEHDAALSKDERARLFPKGVTDTIATELCEFYRAVRQGGPIEVDGVQGLKDEALSIAIYESAALGQPVEIARVESGKISAYQDDINRALGL
jgi:predicted dehydrogenase